MSFYSAKPWQKFIYLTGSCVLWLATFTASCSSAVKFGVWLKRTLVCSCWVSPGSVEALSLGVLVGNAGVATEEVQVGCARNSFCSAHEWWLF